MAKDIHTFLLLVVICISLVYVYAFYLARVANVEISCTLCYKNKVYKKIQVQNC